MDGFSLDIRTLNFITILFSMIYCIGLILIQKAQKPIEGLSLFAVSILIIGSGPLLLSLRGVIPDAFSVIGANVLVAIGFHLTLYSLSLFRNAKSIWVTSNGYLIVLVLLLFVYFTYFQPSTNSRVIIISSYLSYTTILTAVTVVKGVNDDLPLATKMLALTFFSYGCFMLLRVFLTLSESEISDFMNASLVHQLAFLLSIILIVSMSFLMLWLINARLIRNIHVVSNQDPLTSLFNRRSLEESIANMQAHAKNKPVSVVLMDIDNFKSINDQYGHRVGDEVIKSIAKITLNALEPGAQAFRLGGDEMLIILPDFDLNEAKQFAEKLRHSVSQSSLAGIAELRFTSSFGIAELSAQERGMDCIERADKALYNAKSDGRNLVSAIT